MYILCLEASTTSAKAMLYNTDDHTFSVGTKPFTGNYEDVTIHNAENVYNQMMELGREIAAGKKIDMISLSGTWHSIFLCDQEMKPVTPVYLWSFTGAAPVCARIRQDEEYVKQYYHKTGCMVHAIYPYFKLQLLQEQGYDLKDYYIMGQGTYNTFRMTGERVITPCLASGTGMLNTHTKTFDPELLAAIGIEAAQLSRLVDYDASFPLTQEAADLLGVDAGIPVIPTNSDGGLNQIGAGAAAEGVMTFSVGTSGAIRLTTADPVIPDEPSTWCYMSPAGYLSGAATNGCCNCIDWCKNTMFPEGTSYGMIEQGITDHETNPVFLPFLFGERCPGWSDEKKGGFMDMKPAHKANDFYLGVQEGVLFNLYHCYHILCSINREPDHIRLSGGILHSKAWAQMCADIFRHDMEVDDNEHVSLLGAAVLGMKQLGLIDKLEDYRPEPSAIIRYNPEKKDFYARKFERYLSCYKKQ